MCLKCELVVGHEGNVMSKPVWHMSEYPYGYLKMFVHSRLLSFASEFMWLFHFDGIKILNWICTIQHNYLCIAPTPTPTL